MSETKKRRRMYSSVANEDGLVIIRQAHSTGAIVGLYDSALQSFRNSPKEEWMLRCSEHGSVSYYRTRAAATDEMSQVHVWCPNCATAYRNNVRYNQKRDKRRR